MNKFTKLILTSAVAVTSGFATQQDGGTISGVGQIDQGATMEMEAGIKANMDNKAVIHNYHIIQGPASGDITAETVVGDENKTTISGLADDSKAVISGTSEEKIINYDHIMEEDAAFAGLDGFEVTEPTYFRPTGGAKIQGAVDTTEVTVTSAMADLIHAIDLHNEGTDVMLLTTNCQEEDKTMRLTNSDKDQVTVNANIANEVATGGGSDSHSLVIRGAFRFEGDQSRFNQADTTLKFTKSHSEIGTPKSLFMRPIDVTSKSELVIDAEGVEMPHDVTVVNSKFIVNPKASFTLKPGAKLLFQKAVAYPSEKPLQMTWEDGSFSGELTEVNKNYYTVTFSDGSSKNIYWDESSNTGYVVWDGSSGDMMEEEYFTLSKTESGGLEIKTSIYKSIAKDSLSSLDSREADGKTYYTVPLKYDQSVEIYEDPENAGQYKTDAEGFSVNVYSNSNNISISNYNCLIKTLTPEEVASPSRKELIYAHDDVFSYTYDAENENWVRYRQVEFISPEKFAIVFDASPEKASGETDINNVLFYAMTNDQTRMIALHADDSKGAGHIFKRDDISANWNSPDYTYHLYVPSIRSYLEGDYTAGWYFDGAYLKSGVPIVDPNFYKDFIAKNFSLYTYDQVKDQLPSFS